MINNDDQLRMIVIDAIYCASSEAPGCPQLTTSPELQFERREGMAPIRTVRATLFQFALELSRQDSLK